MARPRVERSVQAWIELIAADPEAVSALAVARARLAAGARLAGLRRFRVFELGGRLPPRRETEDLLHRSTRFYNPHKERCVVRMEPADPAPLEPAEQAVLVFDRDGERRDGAERWWRHETGEAVTVREGVVFVLRFEPGEPAAERTCELAVLRGRLSGLLCNPHSQEHRTAAAAVPLPWMTTPARGGTR
ncbi:MAG: hypothetical protein HZC42_13260 [Candidatus Eisenbacteria bacterium]|nr:hypothetical protein [Candidatus Eisenbacteria bacterium]